MKAILYIVTEDSGEFTEFIKTLAKGVGAQIVVMGLLEKTYGHEMEKSLWHTLFEIQTDSSNDEIVTKVYLKRGGLDTILSAVQTLDVLFCAIPKNKVYNLETEEFEELMKSVRCPFMLY